MEYSYTYQYPSRAQWTPQNQNITADTSEDAAREAKRRYIEISDNISPVDLIILIPQEPDHLGLRRPVLHDFETLALR